MKVDRSVDITEKVNNKKLNSRDTKISDNPSLVIDSIGIRDILLDSEEEKINKDEIKKAIEELDNIEKDVEDIFSSQIRDKMTEKIEHLKEIYFKRLNSIKDNSSFNKDGVEEIKSKLEFIKKYEIDLLALRTTIEHSANIDEFLKTKKDIIHLLKEAINFGIKNPRNILGFIVGSEEFNSEEKRLSSVGERGLYLAHNDLRDRRFQDGGDWWSLESREDIEVGMLLDVEGHGFGAAFQKILIKKGFELVQKEPEEKRKEAEIKLDEMFGDIYYEDGGTSAAFTKVEVFKIKDKEGNVIQKKVKLRQNGENIILIYLPEKKEIYFTGLYDDGLSQNFINLSELKPFENKNIESGQKFGFGFWGEVNLKTGNENIGKEGEYILPNLAEIIIASDGISDEHNKLFEFDNLQEVLKSFLNESGPKDKDRLVNFLRKIFTNPKIKLGDDLTFIEVGR